MKWTENAQAKPTNSKINITGMEFYAYHGCFEEERKIGCRLVVDISIKCETTEAIKNDDVSKTVNYQEVYLEVKKIMDKPVNLLETLCNNILTAILQKFSHVSNLKVTVTKMNPSLSSGGLIQQVSVSESCNKYKKTERGTF